jgi:hypothetical protein
MKIKLLDIVNNVSNLKELQEIKLPVKAGYRLMRLVNRLDPILKSYDEKRNELVKEYGDQQEDGNIAVKDPEKTKLFMDKLKDLLSIEEEVEFTPFNIDDLGDVKVETKLLINFLFE